MERGVGVGKWEMLVEVREDGVPLFSRREALPNVDWVGVEVEERLGVEEVEGQEEGDLLL